MIDTLEHMSLWSSNSIAIKTTRKISSSKNSPKIKIKNHSKCSAHTKPTSKKTTSDRIASINSCNFIKTIWMLVSKPSGPKGSNRQTINKISINMNKSNTKHKIRMISNNLRIIEIINCSLKFKFFSPKKRLIMEQKK